MTDPIIYKNTSAVLRYSAQYRMLQHEFLQRPTSADFRHLLDEGYRYVLDGRANKWLSDDRRNTLLDDADEKWGQSVWFPRMAKAGWQYWAIVNPEKAVGQMQMKRNATVVKMGGVSVSTFSIVYDALKWLRTVESIKKAG